MAKKMTKKEMFAQLLNNYNLTSDEIAFINKEIELLEKKNGGAKKPTKQQMANADIKDSILDAMESGQKYRIADLLKVVDNLPEDMTPQRMSALIRQLKLEGAVIRTEEKRVAYFTKADQLKGFMPFN